MADPVVSSDHLAASALPALSEFEFALTMGSNAFHRWITRCAAAAGAEQLSAVDVVILHHIRHRDRAKTLADLCLVLNVEDTHVVNYALRKLTAAGLVETGRQGKEKTATITEEGRALCDRYAAIREQLLIRALTQQGFDAGDLSRLATLLRALSGSYDQATRAAAAR